MSIDISNLKDGFLKEASQVKSTRELNKLKAKFLGKKGIVTEGLKGLSRLPKEERPAAGKALNELKRFIESEVKNLQKQLEAEEAKRKLSSESVDITLPGRFIPPGNLHPVTQVMEEIVDIFVTMGFGVEEGPEVELDYYNFEALNIPKDHPAREMQDTFYVNPPGTGGDTVRESDIVLRTHTSPVQIRGMKKRRPPLRFIAPGKVYRCDADVSHTPMFHQIEGLMVGEDITFSHLKGVLELFVHRLFGPGTPVRFRPSYFPFTEPSTEVDIGCILCGARGCRVCKGTGWLEVLGAGMVHPRVFEAVGYDTERYTGFAFGMGVERLTMLKYKIDDIRLFFENDLRFLRQF
ncbi:MAG TPA: phenylalanine--tRNA ligase subunit alpha [Nitrospirae bacterium]|nr:phenylalanine--tRNA ligase subunit alpha [Nitrospirota bacterium]